MSRRVISPFSDVAVRSFLETLPADHRPYTDCYFLRAAQILRAKGHNPWVRAQLFLRHSTKVAGIHEALAVLMRYGSFLENGGQVWTLPEGSSYNSNSPSSSPETLMVLEGRALDVIELETMLLGIISATSSAQTFGLVPNLAQAAAKVSALVALTRDSHHGPRPITYFGARHYHYRFDQAIAEACIGAGASGASTEIGAATHGLAPQGTIPHALENVFAYYWGKARAVVESTKAFDEVMPAEIPRVALVDYRNHEIDDALRTARALGTKLAGVRIDTHGGNFAQGALKGESDPRAHHWPLPEDPQLRQYWLGPGVTVSAAASLRRALDEAGRGDVGIILTSGFGKIEKVDAFIDAEKRLGLKLFDALGVGEVTPAHFATFDFVAIGEGHDAMSEIYKDGRPPVPNPRLLPVFN